MIFSMFFLAGLYSIVWGVKAYMKRRGAAASATRTAVWVTSIVLALAYVGCLTFLSFQGLKHGWFKEDVETYEYHNMTWEIHHDELPLTIEDLAQTDYVNYSTKLAVTSSPLLTQTDASQRPRMDALDVPGLDYIIYDARFGLLTDFVFDKLTAGPEDPWEAREEYRLIDTIDGVDVYQLYRDGLAWDHLILRGQTRVVHLHPGWGLTGEQIETVVEILMG